MHWRDDAQAIVEKATLELYYTGRDNGNTLTLGAHRVRAIDRNSVVPAPPQPPTHLTGSAGSAILRNNRDGRHEADVEPGV
jgi:hypothetical protein